MSSRNRSDTMQSELDWNKNTTLPKFKRKYSNFFLLSIIFIAIILLAGEFLLYFFVIKKKKENFEKDKRKEENKKKINIKLPILKNNH